MGVSASMSGDTAVVKVCCTHFKDEVENELQQQFGLEFTEKKICLQLPGFPLSNMNVIVQPEE